MLPCRPRKPDALAQSSLVEQEYNPVPIHEKVADFQERLRSPRVVGLPLITFDGKYSFASHSNRLSELRYFHAHESACCPDHGSGRQSIRFVSNQHD